MKFEKYLFTESSNKKMVGIFIGRVTPVTVAHQKIINDAIKKYSNVYIIIIEGEKSSTLKKNFLSFQQRKELLKITNPKAKPILSKVGYIPDIIEQEGIDTFNGVAIIAGSDRIDGYKKQFQGVEYDTIFDEIKRTDDDVSASKVRQALSDKDFDAYSRMVAKGLDNKKWFDKLREYLSQKGNTIKEQVYTIGEILNEDVNKHMEHFEDNMFNNGVSGIQKNIDLAKTIRNSLSGGSKTKAMITTKFDGSPAVFFGINPENGKFFVSTKAIFNKTPKLAYNYKDVDELFGHAPGLAAKLKSCLSYLPSLNVDTIYQGDLLFTDDKKKENINGAPYITFTPNTITYAIPDDDSDLARRVRKAKLGIVVHTEYSGNNLDELSAKFNIDVSSHFNNADVWLQDAYFRDESGAVNFSKSELDKINGYISEAERVAKYIKGDIFKKLKSFGLYELFRIFHNQNIKGAKALQSVSQYFTEFITFIEERYGEQIKSLKSDDAKKKRQEQIDNSIHFLNKYKKEIVGLFYLYLLFIRLKETFVQKFSEIKNIDTFIRGADGFNVTKPEGFCVIDNEGNILKLVDRLEFSRANFTLEKNW